MARWRLPDNQESSQIVRKALQPDPVARDQFPKWVLTEVNNAIEAGKLPEPQKPLLAGADAFHHATKNLGGLWVDHAGMVTWKQRQLLVSEPYVSKMTSSMLREVERFVELVKGGYFLTCNSEFFPGQTIRIVVGETRRIALDYQNHTWARYMRLPD